ncbi:hypothetical protein PSET11_03041 [Arthrobacter ulcerisalmonis]|uniref:Uncharacterized protein n=1 Tax=Arthrobacter ulcerisalmonis TaxID=2483813 RepID=A0A3P5XN28_9MICC|nr:hypothetical protein PSET11_03041 [Arthrobacter ulcerisalmonis]
MTETVCVNCSALIEQVGKSWYHRPSTGKYIKACPAWGYVATPQVLSA